MKVPVKLYIPVLAILLVLGVGAVFLHWHWTTDKSKTVEFAGAIVGGITALYGLLSGVQQRRASSAARFIERWNHPDFAPYRKMIRSTIDNNGPPAAVEPHQTSFILSFWEEIAIAVHSKEADEDLLKKFFYTACLRYYAACKTHIRNIRDGNNQQTAYIQYETLYNRWCPKA
jgi:hypothetical protein